MKKVNKGRWTKEEDSYIIANYDVKSDKEMAEELNRTYQAVSRRRSDHLGIKRYNVENKDGNALHEAFMRTGKIMDKTFNNSMGKEAEEKAKEYQKLNDVIDGLNDMIARALEEHDYHTVQRLSRIVIDLERATE